MTATGRTEKKTPLDLTTRERPLFVNQQNASLYAPFRQRSIHAEICEHTNASTIPATTPPIAFELPSLAHFP